MIASDYRHLITITQQVASGVGSRGQDEYTIETIGTVRAKIEDLSGRKLELCRQIVATATNVITLRYIPNVRPFAKVTFDGRTFDIGAVSNRLQNCFQLELIVTETQI